MQGENGVVVPPPGYLRAAREITAATGTLLVLDEIQTGIGRTGRWFAAEAEGVEADVVTLAKGLGGGLPIGATLAFGRAAGLLTPGTHGSTFGGNPVVCAAALAVLDTVEREGLLGHVSRAGQRLRRGLESAEHPLVREVRGAGLLLGVALAGDLAARVQQAAQARGLLVNAVAPSVIRLAPPLNVSDGEVDLFLTGFASALSEVHAGAPGGGPRRAQRSVHLIHCNALRMRPVALIARSLQQYPATHLRLFHSYATAKLPSL